MLSYSNCYLILLFAAKPQTIGSHKSWPQSDPVIRLYFRDPVIFVILFPIKN